MIYYLGLAKSSLDLKGAKAQKLELDLLRLIYLIKTTKTDTLFGFFMVYDEKIVKRCGKWLEKYEAKSLLNNFIFIDTFSDKISPDDMTNLLEEKEGNRKGNLLQNSSLANANFGRNEVEQMLHQFMLNKINSEGRKIIETDISQDKIDFGISWDGYYQTN